MSATVSAGVPPWSYVDELGDRLAALGEDEFPNTVALAAELTEPDLDSRFEFALARMVDGVAALRAASGQ